MGTANQPPSTELAAILEWMQQHVGPLIASGETCTVTLHIGQGDIRAHVERKFIVKPPKPYRPILGPNHGR